MRVTRASAPAKLVLAGEYAVLHGAPAVVAAVDRRARVEARPTSGTTWHVRMVAGEGAEVALEARPEVGLVDPQDRAAREVPATALLAHVVEAAAGGDVAAFPALDLVLDTRALHDDAGTKLGLGSSAAVAVALLHGVRAAWAAAGASPPEADPFDTALEAHRAAQGGRGSGVDVAASHHGGVLAFWAAEARAEPLPALPLPWLCVFTGHSVRTRDLVDGVAAWAQADPAAHAARMGRLAADAEAARAAFAAEDAAGVLAALAAYEEGLEALGRDAGVDILSAPHRALARLAHAAGAIYKPSGAGGGDVGIALATTHDVLREAAARMRAAGHRIIDLALEPEGARAEVVEDAAP